MHTPGPWAKTPSERTIYKESIGTIAHMDDSLLAMSANAKLIQAAPDMLAVLKEAVDCAVVYDTNPALLELFRAVIAKAEGK